MITQSKTLNLQLDMLAKMVELHYGMMMRSLYATDASVYRQLPLAVAFPKKEEEIVALVNFAIEHNESLIPRTAGTSLAGQCVGEGIVVDMSRYMCNIISFNKEERWVVVQPGVIRDELNRYLKDSGLFFSPNTSTSNRCMLGGMVGNNSSGSTSIRYGVTRDKVLSLRTILSDGSIAEIMDSGLIESERDSKTLYHGASQNLYHLLKPKEIQNQIGEGYPDEKVKRRNTGYPLDEIIKEPLLKDGSGTWNLSKLFCGSEGTLGIVSEIKLRLDPLPPKLNVMIVAHFDSVDNCLSAVVPVMNHRLFACEMMDKVILDCTKDNPRQAQNRLFLKGDPKAILMLELKADDPEDLDLQLKALIETLEQTKLCTHFAVLYAKDIDKAFELRKAGLGVLANLVGDKKSVACIEDTAVSIDVLTDYIKEFTAIMTGFNQTAIYYAHAGAGELHLRPMLNLKTKDDVLMFREISSEVAKLVKRYNGSLSGEHGDGRVRAEFIPIALGENNYELLKKVKNIFDPKNIFNPGKIVNAKPMDEDLRYIVDRQEPRVQSFYNFDEEQGLLNFTEKCNGSGDCRKLPEAGGGMCPSYHVTKNEKDVTRARANMLREVITNSSATNVFDSKELKEVYDLCVGCKACANECPSNVDVAIMKSEFLYQYRKDNGREFRDWIFANNFRINKVLSIVKPFANLFLSGALGAGLLKRTLGIARKRNLPMLSNMNLKRELVHLQKRMEHKTNKLYLFIDEFTRMNDAYLAIKTIELLDHLGYEVLWVDHEESGRSFISKGFLPQAKKVANKNIDIFSKIINEDTPLLGIEPSAILSFRDEYIRLADDQIKAKKLAENTFLVEEFISHQVDKGRINSDHFTEEDRTLKVHVHCHQKALSQSEHTMKILSLPKNYNVELIETGCCGMAGSFGYEGEHYDVSMQMGEINLLPKIRAASKDAILVANGTSCRHQIKDGTEKTTIHPVEVLWKALKK
ncbi:MAG: FAD/FMN-containing dehydrogenase/Fe-S oxidoreductase [Patiriisocius sp.]|jgi:FAD/FMN-containing dehydrogenase/Fe-S oxidoreductase